MQLDSRSEDACACSFIVFTRAAASEKFHKPFHIDGTLDFTATKLRVASHDIECNFTNTV